MQINGQELHGDDIKNIITQLKSAGTGFRECAIDTGHYLGRGESEHLRSLIEADIKSGKNNPKSYNFRPAQPDAYRVEGGEVGFSAKEPIGTDNTHDCIVVMLRDPITKKTALAHITGNNTEESLKVLWDGMTQSGSPIEMRLLGGR